MKTKTTILPLAVAGLLGATVATSMAATTSLSSGNWQGGAWSAGQPGAGDDAVINGSVNAAGVVDAWSGTLTVDSTGTLNVSSTTGDFNALSGAGTVFMNGGTILNNWKSQTVASNFALSGGGTFDISGNSAWNQDQVFSGVFSGTGGLSFKGGNHQGMTFTNTNTFTGGLTFTDQNQRYGVGLGAAGATGLGDVTVTATSATGQSALLVLQANDVFAPAATINLNGAGFANSSGGFGPFAGYLRTNFNIDMQGFDATVAAVNLNGTPIAPGNYTSANAAWLGGTGTLSVIPEPSTGILVGLAGLGLLRRRR